MSTSKERRRATGNKRVTRKKPEIIEYFRARSIITVPNVLDVMNDSGIEYEPHDGQWDVIDAYEDRVPASLPVLEMAKEYGLVLDFEYRNEIIIAACGRRFGKSDIAAVLGATEMLVPHAKVLIVSKTKENCEIIFDKIHKIILDLIGESEISAYRSNEMEIELKNGAAIRVAGKDNVEAKLGRALSLLILDEAKLYPKKLYEQTLRPMLADYAPYSRTVLISSPAPGWFETYYKRGQNKDNPAFKRYWSINLPSHSNPTLSREWLAEQEKTMPRDLYEQEILGLFTSNSGLVCGEFRKDDNIFELDDYPQMQDWIDGGNVIIHMIDSGYTHYFASIWVMYVEELDTFFVLHEYMIMKALTSVIAEYINEYELQSNFNPSVRYADPAAAQQIADFTEYDLYFNKAEKRLKETINNLNNLFFQKSEVTGKPRLLVSSECRELIRQLTSVIWKTGREDDQTKENSNASQGVKPFLSDGEGPNGGGSRTDWDLFDAFRYGMFSFVKGANAACSVFDATESEEQSAEKTFEQSMADSGWFKI